MLNGNIDLYNKTVTAFPDSVIASMFHSEQEKRMDEEYMEENRQVSHEQIDFSKF